VGPSVCSREVSFTLPLCLRPNNSLPVGLAVPKNRTGILEVAHA